MPVGDMRTGKLLSVVLLGAFSMSEFPLFPRECAPFSNNNIYTH